MEILAVQFCIRVVVGTLQVLVVEVPEVPVWLQELAL
jgi:hypothetical protein